MFKELILVLAVVSVVVCDVLPGHENQEEDFVVYPPRPNDYMPQNGLPKPVAPHGAYPMPSDPPSIYAPTNLDSAVYQHPNSYYPSAPDQPNLLGANERHQTEGVFQKFNGHVKNLVKTTSKGTKKLYQDAKPHLTEIRGDATEALNNIRNHPSVVKGVGLVKPHYETVKGKTINLKEKLVNLKKNRSDKKVLVQDGVVVSKAPHEGDEDDVVHFEE